MMTLSGTESISIELAASIDAAAVDALALSVPAGLSLERSAAGRGNVSVLVLEMRGLGLRWALPKFDYREVLYRLGVTAEGAPSWLALRCDLDRAVVRTMAGAIIRYPVRRAAIEIDEPEGACTLRATTDTDLLGAKLQIEPAATMPEATPPRRTFVVDRGRLFEVPWNERAAPERHHARVMDLETSACSAVFGAPVAFEERALIHRGRTHFCGAARAWPRT